MIRFAGATPVPMRLREELGYNPDPDDLAGLISPRTRLIIVNSPNNPCGSVIPDSTLQRIAELAVEADAVVLSDEIYKDFYYEGSHTSITSFPSMWERTVVLDGLSKSYAMTGWRLGYGIFPEPLVEPVTRLVTNSVSCTAAFGQIAAVTALQSSQESVREMVSEFNERRDLLSGGAERPAWRLVPDAEGSVLHLPEHHGHGDDEQRVRARRAAGRRGVAAGRDVVRGIRRGVRAHLVRELAGEPPRGAQPAGALARGAVGVLDGVETNREQRCIVSLYGGSLRTSETVA